MRRILTAAALSGACALNACGGDAAGPPLPIGAVEDTVVRFGNGHGVTLAARLWIPQGIGPFPAVVVMHGCGGLLNDLGNVSSEFTGWGRRLTDSGYVALFIDSFTPRGIDEVCGTDTLINEAVDRVYDADAGLGYLRGLADVDPVAVAILGFSNGASAALSAMARDGRPAPLPPGGGFRFGIAWYPGCGLRSVYGSPSSGTWIPHARTDVLHAELDPLQPDCTLRVVRAAALGASAGTGNPVFITTYTGAQHGFDRAAPGDPAWTPADLAARDSALGVTLRRLNALR